MHSANWRLGSAILFAVLESLPAAAAAGPGLQGRVLAQHDNLLLTVRAASIEFLDSAGRVAATCETDEIGCYRVDLPAGTYTYAVRRDGLIPENAGRGVTLKLSDGYAVLDFSLVPGAAPGAPKPTAPPPPSAVVAKLGGRVYEKDKDGKLVGISGATISLRPLAGGAMTTVLTGRSGTGGYEVMLAAGAWRASVRADGFDTTDPQPIDVSADTVTGHDFVLTRLPTKKDQ
jgi:hypothetical protein